MEKPEGRMTHGLRLFVFVLGLLGTAAGGCSSEGRAEAQGMLDWRACFGRFECASLEVPNDQDSSVENTQRLSIARARAGDPGRRLGVLFYNLGGPGVIGAGALPDLHAALSYLEPRLTARFDLIGVDPRGVGDSTPKLTFLEDETLDAFRALDPSPDDESEWRAHDTVADEVLAAASTLDAVYASRVDTESFARDLDLVREALGEDRISFYGGSYGTLLGGVYATLFPERVRAFVLDSSVMPVADRRTVITGQAVGYEEAFAAFAAWCADLSAPLRPGMEPTSACPLGPLGEAGAIAESARTLFDDADESPVAAGERVATGMDLRTAVGDVLNRGSTSWPMLADLIASALSGDATTALAIADVYNGRSEEGRSDDDIVDAFMAISALDAPYPEGFDRAAFDATIAGEADGAASIFGGTIAAGERLTVGWPFRSPRAPPAVSASGAPPALILAGLHDPATPVAWAQEMRAALGNGSSLITVDSWGHGQLFVNRCASDLAVSFLIDPTLLPPDTECPADVED
jgi:pimeloyl-ACP methyl ester carboxylesterase